MKIEMKDNGGEKFEVGYDLIMDDKQNQEVPMFWIDTPYEGVTLVMGRAEMDKLASAIQFLKANL